MTRSECRLALEGLRNGVPNSAAVRLLSSSQPHIERIFLAGLKTVKSGAAGTRGMLITGGFGAGKSHSLRSLAQIALGEGFVVSHVTLSKETPLGDAAKVYRAAVESSAFPETSGSAVQQLAARLHSDSKALAALLDWCRSNDAGLADVFAASVWLYQRIAADGELLASISEFWCGGSPPLHSTLKRAMREAGRGSLFDLRPAGKSLLAMQRPKFGAALVKAAGASGWVILLDEAELIGRYSAIQRAKAYTQLGRWLDGKRGYGENIVAVAAFTDDFAPFVIQQRDERGMLSEKLRQRGRDDEIGDLPFIRSVLNRIEHESKMLVPLSDAALRELIFKLREIYLVAYQWAPKVSEVVVPDGRPLRSYLRRYVNTWDLQRLLGLDSVELEETISVTDYSLDQDLEQSSETD